MVFPSQTIDLREKERGIAAILFAWKICTKGNKGGSEQVKNL